MTATLEVTHDGIRAHATVIHGGRACTLDALLDAAIQQDADLAASYRGILADVAPCLRVNIVRDRAGSRDAGCCWYAVELVGADGTILTRPHQITRGEIRGWNPTAEQIRAAEDAILRRAAEIGLGHAKFSRIDMQTLRALHRTVAEAVEYRGICR